MERSSRRLGLELVLALAAVLGAHPALAAPRAGVMYRQWTFSDGNDMRDPSFYVVGDWFHVVAEMWDFDRGQDQFRPEVGLVARDRRHSAYTLQWRGERQDDRYWVGTEQIFTDHVVLRGDVSPIVRRHDSTLTVWDAGADYYWGSYSFAGVTAIRDPRAEDLWVVPLRARIATEQNDWFQLTLAPASRRSVGWAADFKWRWLRLGVERNSRFDFTNVDNTIVTVGLEAPLTIAK